MPEHAPHFGGLWEAVVKSFKRHLRRVVGGIRLTFVELTTTLAQVEACLNSRPLTAMPDSDEGIEVFDTRAFSGWRSTGGSPRSTGFLLRDSAT